MSEEQSSYSTNEEMEKLTRIANAHKTAQFLERIAPKCFQMCVPKPGSFSSHYEQNCIVKCTDLYINSWIVTAKAFANRVEDERKPHNVSDDGDYFE